MAIPDWPADVPYAPLVSGYDESVPPLAETQVESGPPLTHLRVDTEIRSVDVTIRMTPTERAAFETFFANTLKRGTQKFNMPVAIAGGFATRRCYIERGVFRVRPADLDWLISFTLGVFPY